MASADFFHPDTFYGAMVKFVVRLWNENKSSILLVLRMIAFCLAMISGLHAISAIFRWERGEPLAEVWGLCMTWGPLVGIREGRDCFLISTSKGIVAGISFSGFLSAVMFGVLAYSDILLAPLFKKEDP